MASAPRRVLVLSDSHGTPYAGICYVDYLTELAARSLGASVDRVSFSGVPLAKWEEQLMQLLSGDHDVVILQYGNADVHPRLSLRVRERVRAMTGVSLRDTWFQVPPRFGLKYIVKFPFLWLKRLLVALWGSESYSSVERLLRFYDRARSIIGPGRQLIIVPLFRVRGWLYGPSHNHAVVQLNERLRAGFTELLLPVGDTPLNGRGYVADGFHWREEFHRQLADALIRRIAPAPVSRNERS